jgi:hypothetical protein
MPVGTVLYSFSDVIHNVPPSPYFCSEQGRCESLGAGWRKSLEVNGRIWFIEQSFHAPLGYEYKFSTVDVSVKTFEPGGALCPGRILKKETCKTIHYKDFAGTKPA